MNQNNNSSSDLGSIAGSYSADEYASPALSRFIRFLQYKIKGDLNARFKKELLHSLYEIFKRRFNLEPLSRMDRRHKIRVFRKLYQIKNEVIFLINTNPEVYLNPIFQTQ